MMAVFSPAAIRSWAVRELVCWQCRADFVADGSGVVCAQNREHRGAISRDDPLPFAPWTIGRKR